MEIEFDPDKDARNLAKHGVSLADFHGFDTDPVIETDDRYEYGETRLRAFGRIEKRGYCLVFVATPEGIRVISFRRAHEKEMRRYGS